jgi:hypothetical protein
LIRIFCIKKSPRLDYIAEVIFDILLGIEYQCIEISDLSEIKFHESSDPIILYGFRSASLPCIPADGLLFENTIQKKELRIVKNEMPEIYFSAIEYPDFSIDFDLFSASFYLVTEYEFYLSKNTDEHDRYIESDNRALNKGLFQVPVVDMYANHLYRILQSKYPFLQKASRKFDYRITFDIDAPYLFKNKNPVFTMASLLKKIIAFKFNDLAEQVSILSGKRDPYDVFDEIIDSVDPAKLLFFFLLDRHHSNDGRFTWRSEAYRRLIQDISKRGISTGIHPSYSSYLNSGMIKFETEKLAEITGKPIKECRMHFLKYHLPETFNSLINAGITEDYTLCMLHGAGFRNAISMPVKWFDLTCNTKTGLLLHPTIIMDRSLQKYMGLSPEDSWLKIKEMIDICKQYDGYFKILFHNGTLSEISEWKGWKEVYQKTVHYLKTLN